VTVIADYNYENGSYEGFTDLMCEDQRPASDSFQNIALPHGEATRAGQFHARQAYSPFGWNEGVELGAGVTIGEGADEWYGLAYRYPSGFNINPSAWLIVFQWYTKTFTNPYMAGPAPMAIDMQGGPLTLNVNAGLSTGGTWSSHQQFHLATVPPDTWCDLLLHVVWSSDDAKGHVEAFRRLATEAVFTQVVNYAGATLRHNPAFQNDAPDPIGLLKQGIYRGSLCVKDASGNIGQITPAGACQYGQTGSQGDTVVQTSGCRRATTRADVEAWLGGSPPPPPPPPPVDAVALINAAIDELHATTTTYGYWNARRTGTIPPPYTPEQLALTHWHKAFQALVDAKALLTPTVTAVQQPPTP
jgi:hypothetical protein